MDIKQYLDNLTEALKPEQKAFVARLKERGATLEGLPDDFHDNLFAKYNDGDKTATRIILPLKTDTHTYDMNIARHLHENGGWTIHDYKQGIATRKLVTKKGFVKTEEKSIGALLKDTGGDEKTHEYTRMKSVRNEQGNLEHKPVTEQMTLTQAFNTDPIRQSKKEANHQIVISRHIDDIGGMTSGRDWESSSCMRLPYSYDESDSGGAYHKKIQDDLNHKTLVAYLTHKGDDHVEQPLSRVLLKRFTNEVGHNIFRPELKTYGKPNSAFADTLEKFSTKEFPAADHFKYHKNKDLYDDDGKTSITNNTTRMPKNPLTNLYFDDDYDVKTQSEKKNEFGDYHTDNDEPSLVLHQHLPYNNSNVIIKTWHKNGTIHRDGGPAIVVSKTETNKKNGGEVTTPVWQHEMHLQNGLLHSPRDGKTPSKSTMLYSNGELYAVNHQYHKYGVQHNGTISGFSHSELAKNSIMVTKSLYGNAHTDNDEPSYFKTYPSNNLTMKRWAKHGNTIKTDEDDNGKKTFVYHGSVGFRSVGHPHYMNMDHFEDPDIKIPANYKLPDKTVIGYESNHGTHSMSFIKDRYRYSQRFKVHDYNKLSEHFNPDKEDIHEQSIMMYHPEHGLVQNDGPNGEPAFYQKRELSEEIHHKQNDGFHHATQPARREKRYDYHGNLEGLNEESFLNNSQERAAYDMPAGSILSHNWSKYSQHSAIKRIDRKDGLGSPITHHISYESGKTPATYDEDNNIDMHGNKITMLEVHHNGKKTKYNSDSIEYPNKDQILKVKSNGKYAIGKDLSVKYKDDVNGKPVTVNITPSRIRNTILISHFDKDNNWVSTHELNYNGTHASNPSYYDDTGANVDNKDVTEEKHPLLYHINKKVESGEVLKQANKKFNPNPDMFDFSKHIKGIKNFAIDK